MLQLATQYYTSIINTAKQVLKTTFTVDGQVVVQCMPKSKDIMHFSFNMAPLCSVMATAGLPYTS